MNQASRTARLSIASNTLLIVMKLIVGIQSGAVSIISEAIHSTIDLAAAIMAFFSIRIAQQPADKEHPYGHEKVENISGVIEAFLIFVAAGIIIIEAIKKIIVHEMSKNLELGIAVMLVSGIVNFFVSRRLYKVAHKEESIALEADALHLKTDVYTSLGVGGGLIVIVLLKDVFQVAWAYYLDPLVALVIACLILRESWKMLRRAFAPLLDTSISTDELGVLEANVARYSNVKMHSVRTRRAGKTKYIDFHLTVPGSMTVEVSHELCDEIERSIEKALRNTSVLIHIEPSSVVTTRSGLTLSKDELLAKLTTIGKELLEVDPGVHHLHIFSNAGISEISFHINLERETTIEKAHSLATKFENRVRKEINVEPTIHYEPRHQDDGISF
jgi:cation diffusion facilitator family transporter